MQTPTLTTNPPQVGYGDGGLTIGVAVFSRVMPEPFNHLAHTLLASAIRTALHCDEVHNEHCSFFRPEFSVHLITVNTESQAQAAISAIKQALASLECLDFSDIATFTAEGVWVTIHGLGIGGTNFAKAFLKPEDRAAWAKEAEARSAVAAVFLETLKKSIAQKSNPEK